MSAEPISQAAEDCLEWYDVREWGVEGKGWDDTESYFDRLPARARGVVRPVIWDLSRHSAGMCAAFETDAPEIWARWALRSSQTAMPHMAATGVSGLDLYARNDAGQWRWLAVGKPETPPRPQAKLIADLDPGTRAYRLYLPLYNGVTEVAVGVPKGASFRPIAPRQSGALLFYGTSIVHGASASRTGMPHPAILGRRLDRPVLNLGFSGNGIMEPEVADLLAEQDPAIYIIDCLPNMVAEQVTERAAPLVRTLRRAHPRTPIVLVEDRTYANAAFVAADRARHASSRRALRDAFECLRAEGVEGLCYLAGESLLGDDDEATVDRSHPTDLGFMRMADALEPILRSLL